ncbi:hypothetical protein ABK040_005115 [Willaertia magna]
MRRLSLHPLFLLYTFLFIGLLFFVQYSFGQQQSLDNGLTLEDQKSLHKTLLNDLNKLTNKKDLFYATVSLSKLNVLKEETEKAIKNLQSKHCTTTFNEKEISSPSDLYYTIGLNTALKCPKPLATENFSSLENYLKKLVEGISENTSTESIYSIVRSILLLKKRLTTLLNDKKALQRVYDLLVDKVLPSSTSKGNLIDVGFVSESISILSGLVEKKNLDNIHKVITNDIPSLMKKAPSADVSALGNLIRGLNKLSNIATKKISNDEIATLTKALSSKKQFAKNTDDIYHLVEGLQFATAGSTTNTNTSNNNTPKAVEVSDVREDKDTIKVTITNVNNNEKVVLQSVYKGSNPDDSILPKGPIKMEPVTPGSSEYQAKGVNLKEPGVYNFDIAVGGKVITRTLKTVTSDLKIRDFQMSIGKFSRTQLNYPNTLGEKLTVNVDGTTRLQVTFSLVGVTPHQVFLRLGNEDHEAIFNIKQYQPNYSLDINLERSAGNSLKFAPGEYQVQLLIGDASIKTPISWTVANVQLTFTKTYEKSEEEKLYEPRPLINHIFRKEEKRAPASIALVFCGVIAFMFLVYLINIVRVGFNFKNCPGGLSGLLAPVFIGLVVAMVGVLTLYFISWDIFDTLNYLIVLGIATTLVGSKVLSGVAKKRVE